MRALRLSVVCLFVVPLWLLLSQRLPAGSVSKGQAAGSLYAPRAGLPARPLVAAAMQMIAGSVLMAGAGVAAGELGDVSVPSTGSLVGLVYLIAVGSLVAFSAYTWLLRATSPALVSTYAYVNPVVAVILGALILNESVGVITVLGTAVIVASVAAIVRQPR